MSRYLTCLLLIVCLAACAQTPATTPTPSATDIEYTAIGASDATGHGASVECFPLTPCPTGTGYVQDVTRQLQSSGKTVTLLNLGIPGAVLSPEIEDIGNSLNRGIPENFIDSELPFVAKNSTLVTIFAGANDVNTIGAALQAGLGGSDLNGYIAVQTQVFGQDFNTLVTGIQKTAPSARLVILNLPNMAALPFSSGDSADEKREVQQIAVAFSAQINTATRLGAAVIDLMCDPNMYQPGFYSADGFHPNDTGYAYLANLVYAAATTGGTPAPQSSCGLMFQF